MPKSGFYIVGGKVIAVQDDSSRDYLKAIENSGVIPNITQNFASNYLVTIEKAINTWSLMVAQYPFIGGTDATHKFNLNDPRDSDSAFRLSYLGNISVVHTLNGLKVGIGAYASTFLNPQLNSLSNSCQLSFYSSVQVNNNNDQYDLSINNSQENFRLGIYRGDGNFSFAICTNSLNNNDGVFTPANGISKGYISMNINSERAFLYYNNNFFDFNADFKSGNSIPSGVLLIGNDSLFTYSNKTFGYVGSSLGFTDTQSSQQSKIVTFFNSLLGR